VVYKKSGYCLNRKRQNYEINVVLREIKQRFAACPKNAVNFHVVEIYIYIIYIISFNGALFLSPFA